MSEATATKELAPGCNRCLAEEWVRDGRGLWAMRECTGLAKHGGRHSFTAWHCYMKPPGHEVYGYLSRLFLHYAPQCEPLPTLPGLATQIDNLLVGMRRQEEYNAAVAAELADQVNELVAALKGVVRVADRKTVEFDAARAAIAKAEGRQMPIPEGLCTLCSATGFCSEHTPKRKRRLAAGLRGNKLTDRYQADYNAAVAVSLADQCNESQRQFHALVADHGIALEFIREIAASECPVECGNCIICRAKAWLHTEAKEGE